MTFLKQSLSPYKNLARDWVKKAVPVYRKAKHAFLTRWIQLNNPDYRSASRGVEWDIFGNAPVGYSFKVIIPEEKLVWKGGRCGPALKAFFPESKLMTLPEERVGDLCNVQFIGTQSSVGVSSAFIGQGNRLIAEYSTDLFELENHAVFSTFRLPKPQKIEGLCALLHTQECDHNYYAFTLELLPKLHLMALAGYPAEKFDAFVVNRCTQPFQKELLKLAGVPAEKLVMANATYNFSLDRVIVTPVRSTEGGFASWRIDYLRKLLGVTPCKPTRRLLITRRSASNRRLLNEEELFEKLAQHGFEMIDCGKLSVQEQADIFREAAIVVGVHGAGLTNLIYSSPGTRLVEIMNINSPTRFFSSISTLMNIDHQIIDGRPQTQDKHLKVHRMHRADYTVKVDDVMRALQL